VSARNALKHGILSREIILPGEDADALAELGKRLRTELRPAGELETLLVDRITAAVWRLRRLGRVEAEVFTGEVFRHIAERARIEAEGYEKDPLEFDAREITDEKKHDDALERAEEAESHRNAGTLGLAFVTAATGPDAFSKLARYEAGLERSLYRALHELQRLQATRIGQAVPPPVVVDVEVSGAPGGA
jgi:hypothetical protein